MASQMSMLPSSRPLHSPPRNLSPALLALSPTFLSHSHSLSFPRNLLSPLRAFARASFPVRRLKQNQWVYDVCVERRCTVADIRALNPTVNIDRVLAGQRLVVPRRPSPFDPIERELTRAAQQLSTTFAAGPTGGAARMQATTPPASADSDPAASAKKPAGTTAPPAPTAPPPGPSPSLPSAAAPSPPAAPTAPSASARSTKPAARPSGGSWLDSLLGGAVGGGRSEEVEEYVLKRKEWVCDVASRLDVDIEYLRRLNPGVNLDNVRPKQRINVPKSRAARLRQQPTAARGADVAGAGSKGGKGEEETKGKEGGGVATGDAGERDGRAKGVGASLKSADGGSKAAVVAEATASASASAAASRDKPSARQAATVAAPPLCPVPPSVPSPSPAPSPSPSAPSAPSASAPVCAPPPICKPPASAGWEGASAGSQSGGDVCAVPEAKAAGAAREAKGGPAQGVAAVGAVVGGAGGSRGAPAAEASFFEALIRGMGGDGKQKDGAGGTREKQQQKAVEATAPVKQQKQRQQQQAPQVPQQQQAQSQAQQKGQAQGQQGVNQRWRVHRVRRGEWISSLAADYGLTVEQLQDMNPGVDLAKVKPADEIRVPAGRRRATGAALPLDPADVEAMGGALVVAAGGADKGGGGGPAAAGGPSGGQQEVLVLLRRWVVLHQQPLHRHLRSPPHRPENLPKRPCNQHQEGGEGRSSLKSMVHCSLPSTACTATGGAGTSAAGAAGSAAAAGAAWRWLPGADDSAPLPGAEAPGGVGRRKEAGWEEAGGGGEAGCCGRGEADCRGLT
ncbi:unnamed protein product [Closterium sp. NIES-54]